MTEEILRLLTKNFSQFKKIVVLNSTTSTMDTVREDLTDPNAFGPIALCISLEQTAGRGRQGREWMSEKDAGIYLSLGYRYPGDTEKIGLLPIAVGTAICLELQNFSADIGLKWPNDLIIFQRHGARKKLGGILIEAQVEPHKIDAVVGVGINVSPVAEPRGISLEQLVGAPQNYTEIILSVVSATLRGCEAIVNPSNVISQFERFDLLRDQLIRFRNKENRELVGVCQGIAEDGALRVLSSMGEELLYSADVHILES